MQNIGNSDSIKVWKDPWLRDDSNKMISKPLNEELSELKMSDIFMLNSFEQDIEMLEKVFNPRDVKEIMNLQPKLNLGSDQIVWKWEMNCV